MPKTVPQIPGLEPGRLPFSPVVEANGLVFLAGQVGAPPGGEVVPGGTAAETRQVLDNVGQLLRAVGLDYGDVVRCTVFLVDMADFAAMNEVYRVLPDRHARTRHGRRQRAGRRVPDRDRRDGSALGRPSSRLTPELVDRDDRPAFVPTTEIVRACAPDWAKAFV